MNSVKVLVASRLEEAELNKEAAKAAGYYITQKGFHLSMVDQQNMANQVAHGFAMGWRECEKRLGIKE